MHQRQFPTALLTVLGQPARIARQFGRKPLTFVIVSHIKLMRFCTHEPCKPDHQLRDWNSFALLHKCWCRSSLSTHLYLNYLTG